jgi:hypothetical protein
MTSAQRQKRRRETIYLDRKAAIITELERCARSVPLRRPTYTELGAVVGIPPMGPWEPVMDAIAKDFEDAGEPDPTFLVQNKATGYPSRVSRTTRRNLLPTQKARAREELQRLIDKYNPGAPNPLP